MNGYEITPPSNLDAEESVIGSMLIDPEAVPQVLETVSERDFYRDKNQWIASAIQALFQKNQAVNEVTVAEELKRDGKLDAVGGLPYLSNLVERTPTSAHAKAYADVVKKCSYRRSIIEASNAIAEMASDNREPDDVIGDALQRLISLRAGSERGPKVYGELAWEYYDEFCQWVEGGFQPQGLRTGFANLDRALNGLKPGNLIIVASRPSMGKTQMLLQIAKNIARQGHTPLFFSLEMHHRELIHRLVFSEARIDGQSMRGRVDEEKAEQLRNIYSELMDLPMWIDDSPSTKTKEAQTRILSLMAREDVSVMFFDHVSLAGDVLRGENEVQRLGAITKGLKAIARICNVPVVVASQLSREVSKARSDHRPWLEDLRSSGELEQNADVVIGLYRPEYYYPKDSAGQTPAWKNFLELEILKQRQGKANPRGYFSTGLYYDASTGHMEDWQGEFPEVEQ